MVDALPDPTTEAVDLLAGLVEMTTHDAEVGEDLPATWTPMSSSFVLVACDLVNALDTWPIYADCTIRVTVYARTRNRARKIASDLHALLLAKGDGDVFARHKPLTGPLIDRDPDLAADFASFTVRSTVRTAPIAHPGP